VPNTLVLSRPLATMPESHPVPVYGKLLYSRVNAGSKRREEAKEEEEAETWSVERAK
jgi:hypothetical protein